MLSREYSTGRGRVEGKRAGAVLRRTGLLGVLGLGSVVVMRGFRIVVVAENRLKLSRKANDRLERCVKWSLPIWKLILLQKSFWDGVIMCDLLTVKFL